MLSSVFQTYFLKRYRRKIIAGGGGGGGAGLNLMVKEGLKFSKSDHVIQSLRNLEELTHVGLS